MKILALEFSSPQRSAAVLDVPAVGRVGRPETQPAGNPASGPARHLSARAPAHPRLAAGLPTFHATDCVTVGEVVETGPGATRALAMVEEVLREARLEREQIEGLALGLGPGSYTGIRAAIALAQGWQLAREVKLIGLSSAECLAAQVHAEGVSGRVNVVIDAQRDEFYLAVYEIGATGFREVAPLRVAGRADVNERAQAGETLLGPEITRWFPAGRVAFPRAATLGRLALGRDNFAPGETLQPIYLREPGFVKAPPPRIIPES
jgi:tRNA threonylcarbamoyladenosine biosynthesis protein TsaB